jgi:hypothetical protein
MTIRCPSPAMVVALVALVLGAGGTVTAAALITSAGIRDNTIGSVDLHDGTIEGRDVDDGALTGADVARNSLTGADVNELSLDKVPNANRLDGLDSTQLVRKSESFTRRFACAGTAFENGFSADDYSLSRLLKFGQGPLPALFRCSVNIPDGALVTDVSFAVKDTDAAQDVRCSMWRTNVTTEIGAETAMADNVATSGTPGDVRITDPTIDQPVIDNGNFAYFLQCWVGTDGTIGLYGATVTYAVNHSSSAGRPTVEPVTDDDGRSSSDDHE